MKDRDLHENDEGGQPPTASATIEFRWGRLLPEVKASARVPGTHSRLLLRLLVLGVLAMALILTVSVSIPAGISLWLLVLLLTSEVCFSVIVIWMK